MRTHAIQYSSIWICWLICLIFLCLQPQCRTISHDKRSKLYNHKFNIRSIRSLEKQLQKRSFSKLDHPLTDEEKDIYKQALAGKTELNPLFTEENIYHKDTEIETHLEDDGDYYVSMRFPQLMNRINSQQGDDKEIQVEIESEEFEVLTTDNNNDEDQSSEDDSSSTTLQDDTEDEETTITPDLISPKKTTTEPKITMLEDYYEDPDEDNVLEKKQDTSGKTNVVVNEETVIKTKKTETRTETKSEEETNTEDKSTNVVPTDYSNDPGDETDDIETSVTSSEATDKTDKKKQVTITKAKKK